MNVLLLHSELGVLRGGGENFTRNLFSAFAERGHRIAAAFVADRHGGYPLPMPSAIYPIPITGWWSSDLGQATLSSIGRYFPAESRYKEEWNRIQAGINWRVFRWHKRRFQRRIESKFSERWGDFQAVYVHGDATLANMVARHRPTVLRLPGPVTADLEPMLRKIHAVCANGDALVRIQGFLGNHATELPIGIDSELFKPGSKSVRSKLEWTDEHKVFGYVGRLTQLKGVDLLVAAFREISARISNVRLLIVGQGELESSIRSILVNELAHGIAYIEPDVYHVQLPDWYRAMNFVVMPSRYENFSNAALEAMSCGVPVLASDIGGNRLLIENGAGRLFQANSVCSLSGCLRDAVDNANAMKTAAEIHSRHIAKRYSWAASAERLESIISSCLGLNK